MEGLRINKYYPVAFLYFFVNGVLLPHGLLYTTLLTPLFLVWLFKFPAVKQISFFFIVLIPFAIVQLSNGVNMAYYLKSVLLLFSVYVFAMAFYRFLTECTTLRIIYKRIIVVNIFLVVIAIAALASPSLRPVFWYTNEITTGVKTVRLQLLTYEPSYYSILLVPIALYYYLKMIVLKLPNPLITFLLVTIPFLLALSFGGIFGMLLALLLTLLWGYNRFFDAKFTLYLLVGGIFLLIGLVIVLIVFHDNVFVIRFSNVFSGKDSSFRGRTFDSFYLGWQLAAKKSILFGVGPGQVKLLGLQMFKAFYKFPYFQMEDIAIPNSVGDTLATFGVVGVCLRLGLEIYFFFKTRVYYNYYRLSLFLFIFIYQFTGSYLTNIAEYAIWMLAFHPAIFGEFDKINFNGGRQRRDYKLKKST